ncbi:hypothetical protein H4F80_25910, partial [Citrobacter braakii]|nr:hypothetical protein [Citrobacter braakii]
SSFQRNRWPVKGSPWLKSSVWIEQLKGSVLAFLPMKRGAVDFLQKPVSAAPLQAALEHAVQISHGCVKGVRWDT